MEPNDNRGWVVWAKLRRNHQFWPGMVVSHQDCAMEHPGLNHRWVYWFEDHRVSKVENSSILDFIDNFESKYNKNGSQHYKNGVMLSLSVVNRRYNFRGFADPKSEPVKNEGLDYNEQDLAKAMFIPDFVAEDLNIIKKKVKEADEANKVNEEELNGNIQVKTETMDEDTVGNTAWDNEMEIWITDSDSDNFKDMQRSNKVSLKEGTVKLSEICICCQEVSPVLRERHSHPLFEGLCCEKCYEQVKVCMFDIGEDRVHIYCTICATPGDMFICDNRKCCKVYCHECIEQFWDRKKINEIQRENPWVCFLCAGDNTSKYLKINPNWKENVMNLFKTAKSTVFNITVPEKRKISVISMNDVISAGLVALEELGLDISHYYAFERRPKAVHISLVHHGAKPYYKNLGTLNRVYKSVIAKHGPVDLFIGGSYNDLRLSKETGGDRRKDKNSLEPETSPEDVVDFSTLVPFYEFFRVLLESKQNTNENHPQLWLFVSDANISTSTREIIGRNLECDPIVLNARMYLETCHARLAWTNIPGLDTSWITSGCKGVANLKLQGVPDGPVTKDAKWIAQMEKSYGFAKNYTGVCNANILLRQLFLGRSGNVVILKKILQPLCKLFAMKQG